MNVTSTILVLALVLLMGSAAAAKPGALPQQIITWVMNDLCSSGCSDEQRTNYRRNIRFESHDLNGDGIAEIFAYVHHHDWCGNHFNCGYSIFQRGQHGYRLLANGYPALRVTNRLTNAYRDLESRHDIGVCVLPNRSLGRDVFIKVLRYDGTQYKVTDLGEQCRKPVPVPPFLSAASNKSLDASCGGVFRIVTGAAMLE